MNNIHTILNFPISGMASWVFVQERDDIPFLLGHFLIYKGERILEDFIITRVHSFEDDESYIQIEYLDPGDSEMKYGFFYTDNNEFIEVLCDDTIFSNL